MGVNPQTPGLRSKLLRLESMNFILEGLRVSLIENLEKSVDRRRRSTRRSRYRKKKSMEDWEPTEEDIRDYLRMRVEDGSL